MKTIRIDHPGDGQWISRRIPTEPFIEGHNHSMMTVRDGTPIGGFILTNYTGSCITAHMAGAEHGWLTRDLLWMLCDYVFNQLNCVVFLIFVNSANKVAVSMDLRAGFKIEHTVKGGYPNGDILLMTMTRDTCKWLDKPSTNYKRGSGK